MYIENEFIKIEMADPADASDKHFFTRYSHCGYIVQITDKTSGKLLLSDPAEKFHPFSGEGFPDEFEQPIGYDETAIGDCFLKIGVGLEERLSENQYTNHDMHTVRVRFPVLTEKVGSAVIFSQKGSLNKDVTYSYTKKVNLLDKGFSIIHSLKNDGERSWQTLWCSHSFLPLDWRTSEVLLRHNKSNTQLVESCNGNYRFHAEGDYLCDELQVYVNSRIISPEPKILIDLQPGKTLSWTSMYEIRYV